MTRVLFWQKFIVADGEKALVSRNGQIADILDPGKHVMYDPANELTVETVKIVRATMPVERARLIEAARPDLAARHLQFVEAGPGEMIIVSFDGEPAVLVPKLTTRVFWKGVTRIGIERIDTAENLRIAPKVLAQLDLARNAYVLDMQVAAHETGLLFVDGVLSETLKPGRHAFWQVDRKVSVQKFDLRPQAVEVTAQEILTKDRIALRVTLTAFYRITDAEKTVQGSTNVETALYRLIQFAVRESIATRTLDDILAARDRIDVEVRGFIASRSTELGVETTELGIKDVILPGEVRDLVNKVVEAERLAKANLIRRQEETAATRSLLNTAKLMQENPLLVRLKELEALEKLVEKVGRIDLHATSGNGGFEALLQNLWKMSTSEKLV